MTTKSNKPAHTIRRFSLKAAIWRNESEKGPWYSVTLSRRYKQGEEFKDVSSFNANDLLPMAKMLDEADSWIAQQQQSDRQAAA
jgi:hypothetical protein